MGLFDGSGMLGSGGLQNAIETGVPQASKEEAGESYRQPMAPSDFDQFGASLSQAGEEVELASWEAPPGVARRWGFGRADAPENQGYLYGVLNNGDGEEIEGAISFEWRNATGRETQVVDEAKTSDMNTSDRYNRDKQRPMPEQTDKNRASAFQELVVMFTPETPAADITNDYEIDMASSKARWPTTEYDVA
jgi:hypothetical protein